MIVISLVQNSRFQQALVANQALNINYYSTGKSTRDAGPAHICTLTIHSPVRVRGGTTLEVVPPRTRTGGWTARTKTWAVPIKARVQVHNFLYKYLIQCILLVESVQSSNADWLVTRKRDYWKNLLGHSNWYGCFWSGTVPRYHAGGRILSNLACSAHAQ